MKKITVLSLSILFLFITTNAVLADEYQIPKNPYVSDKEIRFAFLAYEGWVKMDSPQKYGFVWGFISGFLISSFYSMEAKKEIFNEVGGMTFTQIVDSVDKIYSDYPEDRKRYVLNVILDVLPRYRLQQKP